MAKLTPREAVTRIFPDRDREMADSAIAWLDHCGYRIVHKDQVRGGPSEPADEDRSRPPEFY